MYMGVKISDLPAIALPFSGGEKLPIVQSGITRASNLSSFVNFLSGALLADSELKTLSGAWQSNFTTTNANSANWSNSFTVTNANSANWNRGYTAFTNVTANSANWNNSFTVTNANSANWNNVYSTVQSLSTSWEESADILPTVTNYLSTNNVFLSSATIANRLRVNNDVLIFGNLSASGTSTFANTIFSTTTAISVIHTGTGAALWVGNNGTGDIASFYDIDQNIEVLHVAGANGSNPGVGIQTSTPNKTLTVNGEISAKNIIWDATGNSTNWSNSFTVTNANSANWNRGYTGYTTVTANSANWNNVYSTVQSLSTSWEESADILPTVTNYLSTNNVFLSSATILNTLSARSYVNNPTGKTIYVDATTGSDTRNGFSKYDQFKPYATLSAAAAASVTGDLVYVRAGSYFITSQINLNGEGSLYFDPGAVVTVPTGVVAFSYSQNSIPIYIKGHADFVLAGSAGVLTMSGNNTTSVAFESNSISGPDNATGTLFNCASGVLSVDAKTIAMTNTFTASNATMFNITESGKVTARVPFVYCGRFVNGVGAENSGGGAPAQINADIWTLVTYNLTAGMSLNRVTTQFRIVNYNHVGVGAALSWTEDTTIESHVFQGINWTSVGFQPHITFASTAGTATNKIVRLLQSNRMTSASTNSLSSNVAINVGTHSTFAAAPATSNITFKVGSFTVDSDVNNY